MANKTARSIQIAASALAKVNADMTLRAVLLFAAVAADEGRNQGHYAQVADLPVSTASRLLLDLSESTRSLRRKGGADLLSRQENPLSRREIIYTLSPRGRALLAQVTQGIARLG